VRGGVAPREARVRLNAPGGVVVDEPDRRHQVGVGVVVVIGFIIFVVVVHRRRATAQSESHGDDVGFDCVGGAAAAAATRGRLALARGRRLARAAVAHATSRS